MIFTSFGKSRSKRHDIIALFSEKETRTFRAHTIYNVSRVYARAIDTLNLCICALVNFWKVTYMSKNYSVTYISSTYHLLVRSLQKKTWSGISCELDKKNKVIILSPYANMFNERFDLTFFWGTAQFLIANNYYQWEKTHPYSWRSLI